MQEINDISFLKKINLLYVEDDKDISLNLVSVLKNYFKNIFVAYNGLEALEQYSNLKKDKTFIDVIVSDINMPKMNGISLLREIRKEDEDLPFFFTSAYSDESYLHDAIKLNTTGYFIKPIQIDKLIIKLIKECKKLRQFDTIKKQKNELERYLEALDNVAIVSKTDLKGRITFANDFFCELAQYSKEELIGQAHNIIRHPDSPKAVFKDLWDTIQKGETWNGKVKNRAKDGTSYYVNSTVIPIFDDLGEDIVEYVGIRFLTTEDELSKREFRKKVMDNMQQAKKKEKEYIEHINDLNIKISKQKSNSFDSGDYVSYIEKLKKKNNQFKSQIDLYDKEIIEIRSKNEKLSEHANKKLSDSVVIMRKLKKSNEKNEIEIKSLNHELELKKKAIFDLQSRVDEKNKQIENLHDVLKLKEKELNEKK